MALFWFNKSKKKRRTMSKKKCGICRKRGRRGKHGGWQYEKSRISRSFKRSPKTKTKTKRKSSGKRAKRTKMRKTKTPKSY